MISMVLVNDIRESLIEKGESIDSINVGQISEDFEKNFSGEIIERCHRIVSSRTEERKGDFYFAILYTNKMGE